MRPIYLLPALILLLVGLTIALPTPSETNAETELAIVDVRLFDGERFHERTTVLVRDGRIERIEQGMTLSAGIKRISGQRRTLLPGLIDAHTHSFGHARADALRFGVTTVMDMFGMPEALSDAQQQRSGLHPSRQADLFSAGLLATARGGHGTQYGIAVPTVDSPEDADDWVQERLDEGSDFIKIVIEPGRAWGRQTPTLDFKRVHALVEATHARQRLAVAHVSTLDDAVMAVEAGVDGLVHVFADQPASEEFLQLAASRGIFVVPTLVVLAGVSNPLDSDALIAEDAIRERLSHEQLQTLTQSGWGRMNGAAFLNQAIANVTALHQAGIPVLTGSDAPNPGTAHGLSLHHEMEFMVRAGLSSLEALQAATSLSARHFDLDGRGCLQPGCRADMVLIDGDPRESIKHTRKIIAVWTNGHEVDLDVKRKPSEQGGRSSTNLLSTEELDHWHASDDRFLGGKSKAQIDQRVEGAITVSGQLSAESLYPYSGLMWSAGEPFMAPVNLSGRQQLRLRIKGDQGPWMAMLFSGGSSTGRPEQFPMQLVEGGAELILNLDQLGAFDLTQFQAIGVFATGPARSFSFEVVEASLE